MDRPSPTNAKRYSVDAKVHLQFPGEQQPLSAALSNLSEVGLFVVSEITYPASTEFNFRISGDSPKNTITGRGRVAWRRQLAAGTHRPPGMGCEILRLTEGSRSALKQRLLHNQNAEIDRTPPERQSLTQEITQQSIKDALRTHRVERPEYFRTLSGSSAAPVREEPPKSKAPLWIAAAVLLLTLAAFGLIRSGMLESLAQPDSTAVSNAPPPEPVPLRVDDSGSAATETADTDTAAQENGPTPAESTSTPAVTESGPSAPSQAAQTPANPTQAARSANAPASEQARAAALNLARAWSAAWSAQAVDEFVSFYTDDFRPANGLSNRGWRNDRQRKLAAPDFINVTLDEVTFSGTESRGTLKFLQSYRSNTMADVVAKTLEVVRVDGDWRISSELSEPVG